MRQYRGCSRLYYATYTVDDDGVITFGTPTKVGEVKSISREIASESEEVWADNKLDDTVFGGTAVTRTFGMTRIDPAVEAVLLGNKAIEIATGKTAYTTPADGSSRPYLAFGYALHDGNVNQPCEVVWAFKGIVNSISKTANTIDRGTASEGQEIQVTFNAVDTPWTATSGNDLDFYMPLDSKVDNTALLTKWFGKVITPDNAKTELA